MTSITILLTCHNRKDRTEQCIRSIYDVNFEIHYLVTDDGSTDGTGHRLTQMQEHYDITVLPGDGQLYWCGGMRKAIAFAIGQEPKTDYYMLVNDDMEFRPGALRRMVEQSRQLEDSVIVGTVCDGQGKLTYGGIRFQGSTLHYKTVDIQDRGCCDTFNCNAVLLPEQVLEAAGNFDAHYRHAMADFDYGMQIRRKGYTIYSSNMYVGVCERNERTGTWMDAGLSRMERIRRKESPKGLPFSEWFYYVHKNFGFSKAVWHSITPYLRIFAGK